MNFFFRRQFSRWFILTFGIVTSATKFVAKTNDENGSAIGQIAVWHFPRLPSNVIVLDGAPFDNHNFWLCSSFIHSYCSGCQHLLTFSSARVFSLDFTDNCHYYYFDTKFVHIKRVNCTRSVCLCHL